MMPRLSLVLPYYRAPQMLAHQYALWAGYPGEAKAAIEVVLVDDGSPQPAADVPQPPGLPTLRIYRVLEDRPWHQHGARNLGAREAVAPWLFLTDMDHLLPPASLAAVLARLDDLDPRTVHTFFRVDAPTLTPTKNDRGELKPHVNTFLLTKAHYWQVGGYDEDCVGYGTDSYFRRRLKAAGKFRHLEDIHVVRVPRTVVPDASLSAPGVDPKVLRNRGRRGLETQLRLAAKAKKGLGPTTLAFPWERVQ